MTTHYRGTPGERQALDAFIKLLRASNSVVRHSRAAIVAAGLTESRFGVLEALLHLGPLAPGELGRKILKSPGNLTLVIDNLVRDGLIERVAAGSDRRRRPVALTVRGRRLVEEVLPRHVREVVGVFRGLRPEEQETLARICRKLGRSLDRPPKSRDLARAGGSERAGARQVRSIARSAG